MSTKPSDITMTNNLSIRFWGTRGNLTPCQTSTVFGNHTTAVEISTGCPDRMILIDLGSGAAAAGNHALKNNIRHFDIFMTHVHHDHISGMFTFSPFYHHDCHIRIHSIRSDLQKIFQQLFAPPLHPIPFKNLVANIEFVHLSSHNTPITLAEHGLTITTASLPHPQGCTGYRFDDGHNAFVFATDIELACTSELEGIHSLLNTHYPAGLAAFDGFFFQNELAKHAGWGHSSWEQAQDICQETGVKQLLITHHHPAHDDDTLTKLECAASPVRWARESHSWTLTQNNAREQSLDL